MGKTSTQPKRAIRCAIYTRKSSEEGLEQEFNSLQAQREACEAFITSQRHEGWTCIAQHYDDGGVSGATLQRPALQQLLADIQAGRIDAVVTYKVDRLTRSLADFAKIVEIFDQRGVSFVSVTQQFNTTSSMGRLTLNVLLSFAQFEREVTGERIRDKIAASKQKGMWMGGVPPLGYAARDHTLVVIEGEAETVRHIFRRYLVLGSVRLLQQALQEHGITSKRWTSTSGRCWGGKPLARGALYLMLQNRIYRGEIVHKQHAYPGDHAPIIDAALWDQVQAKLAGTAGERRTGARAKQPSLLAGLLYDPGGQPLTPTHAVKGGTRYRYYVSRSLIGATRNDAPEGVRLPAGEIERVISKTIGRLLSDPGRLAEALASWRNTATLQQRVLRRAADLATTWDHMPTAQRRPVIAAAVGRIVAYGERVEIGIAAEQFARFLSGNPEPTRSGLADEHLFIIPVSMALRRIGQGKRMLIDPAVLPGRAAAPDPKLTRLLTRAHRLKEQLVRKGVAIADIAAREKLSPSYVTRLLRLTFLAPEIVRAILDGGHPAGLTAHRLATAGQSLPLSWSLQRQVLGFV